MEIKNTKNINSQNTQEEIEKLKKKLSKQKSVLERILKKLQSTSEKKLKNKKTEL